MVVALALALVLVPGVGVVCFEEGVFDSKLNIVIVLQSHKLMLQKTNASQRGPGNAIMRRKIQLRDF